MKWCEVASHDAPEEWASHSFEDTIPHGAFLFSSIVHQPKNNTIFYLLINRESVLKSNHVPKKLSPQVAV